MPTARKAFKALVLERTNDDVEAAIRQLHTSDLPEEDVLVQVAWSGINFKDGLAVTNLGRIVRRFPLVPGIDLAGTVVESASPAFAPGDEVLATGYGIGEDHWGGYAQFARLQAEWLLPIPERMSPMRAMAAGTAGFTAMLSVMALEKHGVVPGDGDVVVTGASGGVGSFAVALLAAAGHNVVASTGRRDLEGYLCALGAADLMDRSVLAEPSDGPMGSERWSGAVDAVGGVTLTNLIRTTRRHGSIASCGLAGGSELRTTVFPFILRGVNLLGIDSNYCPREHRRRAWTRLATDLAGETIEAIVQQTVTLDAVPKACEELLAGKIRGRVLVDVGA